MKNSLRNSIAISLFVSMAAMADNPIDQILPDAPELAPYGDYAVGVKTLELVNPNQIDIVSLSNGIMAEDGSVPLYDRPLTVEVWYPAMEKDSDGFGGKGNKFSGFGGHGHQAQTAYKDIYIRDGETQVDLSGKAVRNAKPDVFSGPYPLVIVSHGYPGNRFLMTPLAENLASKGYVVAAIDHTDSTYRDQAAFVSTLVNRPLDDMFVLNAMEQLSASPNQFLAGLVDTQNTGLIGYSMGGYGSVVSAGAGVSDFAVSYTSGLLSMFHKNSDTKAAFPDPRLKAVVAIGPWGQNYGLWDAEGLAQISVPILYMAGSADSTSGYETGVKTIFDGSVNTDRYLLTFKNAEHTAAGPMPAPKEAYDISVSMFQHYSDPVWNTVRMNNIAEHFITAFMGLNVKQDLSMSPYFDLIEDSNEGVYSMDSAGNPTAEHTYWKGFVEYAASGLKMEHKAMYE